MQPGAVALADASDGGNRVDTGRRCRSDSSHNAEGPQPGGEVFHDCLFQRGRIHPEFGVHRDLSDVLVADSGRDGPFFHRRMCLLGCVEPEDLAPWPTRETFLTRAEAGNCLACGDDGVKSRG